MSSSPAQRHELPERRGETDRRQGERRRSLTLVPVERRSGDDRRTNGERREAESAAEHIRNAYQLIVHAAEFAELDDEPRRDLDAALFRLRFALERLEHAARGREPSQS